MTRRRRTPAPRGLGRLGRAFWRDVTDIYGLRPDELRLLERACRKLDQLGALDDLIASLDVLTESGSRRQLRMHPALTERRLEDLAFASICRQLGLPNPPGATARTQDRSSSARRLAMARWGTA